MPDASAPLVLTPATRDMISTSSSTCPPSIFFLPILSPHATCTGSARSCTLCHRSPLPQHRAPVCPGYRYRDLLSECDHLLIQAISHDLVHRAPCTVPKFSLVSPSFDRYHAAEPSTPRFLLVICNAGLFYAMIHQISHMLHNMDIFLTFCIRPARKPSLRGQ